MCGNKCFDLQQISNQFCLCDKNCENAYRVVWFGVKDSIGEIQSRVAGPVVKKKKNAQYVSCPYMSRVIAIKESLRSSRVDHIVFSTSYYQIKPKFIDNECKG